MNKEETYNKICAIEKMITELKNELKQPSDVKSKNNAIQLKVCGLKDAHGPFGDSIVVWGIDEAGSRFNFFTKEANFKWGDLILVEYSEIKEQPEYQTKNLKPTKITVV